MALRIGLASVFRPLFKGNSTAAWRRNLELLRHLGQEKGFELFTPSLAVSEVEEASRAAAELAEAELDFLLIQHTTFATGELLAPLLRAVRRVGLWALPETAGGRGGSGPLPLNSLCGLNMTLSSLRHPRVDKTGPIKWFYGEADSPWFRRRLEPTLAALRGLKALEGARILQIGGTAPAFYGIEERPELASVTVDTLELAELFAEIAAVDNEPAQALAIDLAGRERLEAPSEHLIRAARIELALRRLAAGGDYQALAVRCWPEIPDRCGAMACLSLGRLGEADIPAACEGDVMGALAMLILQGVSGQPAALMDLSDLDSSDDSLLFWHCGNAPLQWATDAGDRPNTRLTTHFNRDGLGVVRDMVLRPGPATCFRLLSGGREAMIGAGTFGKPDKDSFDGVRGWLSRPGWCGEQLSARAFVANVLDYHLPHHFAFGMGELTAALEELCAWLGASPLPARSETPQLTTLRGGTR